MKSLSFSTTLGSWMAVAFVALLLVGTPQSGWAQGGCPRGGPGLRATAPATRTTVSGQITSIRKVPSASGTGVHLTLKTADEANLEVQLGPSTYVDKQKLHLAKGDTVQVTGTPCRVKGQTSFVASQVMRGQEKMDLRDASGRPLWAGQGQRRQGRL